MSALSALFPIAAYALMFFIYLKRSVSVSVLFAIGAIVVYMYVFALLGYADLGVYSLYVIAIMFVAFAVLTKQERTKVFFVSVPVVLYLLSSVVFAYMMRGAQLFFWDEYSHWGVYIKEMMYSHHLYDSSSVAAHLNYPPGITLWDYFVIFLTGYAEEKLYIAYFLLLFGVTLPFYERLSFRQIHWIVLILGIEGVLFASFGHWLSSIYVDHVIGAIFAGIVMSYLIDRPVGKSLLWFMLPLTALVLIKEIGLYFAVAAIGLMVIVPMAHQYAASGHIKTTIGTMRIHMGAALLLTVGLIFILKTWEIHQYTHQVPPETQTIRGIVSNIIGDKPVLDAKTGHEVSQRFWQVVFHQQLHKEKMSLNYNEFSYGIMSQYTKKWKLTAVGALVFFAGMMAMAFLLMKDKKQRLEIILIGSYMITVTIVYTGILYESYLVAFGRDALRIPSYVRYMNTTILPLLLIGFFLLLPAYTKKSTFKFFGFPALVLLLLVSFVRPYWKPMYSPMINGLRKRIEPATISVIQKVPVGSTIFVVLPIQNNGMLNVMLRYLLVPLRSTVSNADILKEPEQKRRKRYASYHYIWFPVVNKRVFGAHRWLLKMEDSKRVYTLYKVERRDHTVRFLPVE